MMKNYAIFRHIFYIAAFLLLLCATGCIQSQAQTRRYAATQRKTAAKKRGVTPQQKKTSGNRTTNNPKTPIKKNDVLYINYGETKNYLGRINYYDYSRGILYGKESITGSYKNSVIRNNKSMVIEYNINIDWPRDLNYRDYGDYYDKNLKFLKEVQDLIKKLFKNKSE